MQNTKTVKMVQMAILIAIIILMAFTPIGFIRTGGLEIALIGIPVAIGAMILGPTAGAVLGLTFGVISFIQCFGFSPFGATLLGINPIATFIVCVPTRVLMGYLTGLFTNILLKIDKTKTVTYFVMGAVAAALNTLFFMTTLMLFFWNTDYIQGMNVDGLGVVAFIFVFVGINGACEIPACCIAGGTVAKALTKVVKKAE